MSSTSTIDISTTTTVIVSVTTIFTTPSFCASRSWTVSDEDLSIGITRPERDCVSATWTSCVPPEEVYLRCDVRDAVDATNTWYWPIISPGVCPDDQTVVSTSVDALTSGAAQRTWASCCPRGWTIDSWDLACASDLSTPFTAVYMTTNTVLRTFEVDGTTIIQPQTTATNTAFGVPKLQQFVFEVAWQSSDLSRFTPASAPLLMLSSRYTSSSTSSATSATTMGVGQATTGVTDGGSGLSSSQKLGLEIGGVSVFVVLLCLGIGLYLWRSSRKVQKRAQEEARMVQATQYRG